MKKIAITTLVGENNFGNRLQNFAMQYMLENNLKDFEVFTLKKLPFNTYEINRSKKYKFFKTLYRILNVKKWKNSKIINHKRHANFLKFDENVKFDKTEYFKTNLPELNKKYDYFICGSDQVWNTECEPYLSTYLLDGIDNNKKLSYAASLGKTKLFDFEKELFKKYLPSFKSISVREKISSDILQPFTSTKVEHHLDPVFMVPKEKWVELSKSPRKKINKKYIFLYMLGNKSKEFKKYLKNISKKYNLKIIDILDKFSPYYESGPSEFLYLINNSELVFTDSFHAIAFSIIFEKPFVVCKRIDKIMTDMYSRIDNLEYVFNVKFPNFENISEINDNLFEYKLPNSLEIINREKERTKKYLLEAVLPSKPNNNLNDKVIDCSGCGLCASICPVNAISYIKNDIGFIKPTINDKKCIHCGLCLKQCSELKEKQVLNFENNLFAIKRKIPTNHNYSSTGIFREIATQVLNDNGVVFGVPYNKDSNEFIMIDSVNNIHLLEGSKYYQADITKSYSKIEELLKTKKVLVCATPCQIAGLKTKFRNNSNLILIQVVCHGVPSYETFKSLCNEKYGQIPKFVNFRKKIPDWENFSVEYTLKSSSKIINMHNESYMRLFLSDVALNESCYNCKYAGKQTGADLIIGDCWGIKDINKKFYSKQGVSIICICSKLGKSLFDNISHVYEIYKIPKNKYKYCNINLFKAVNHDKQINQHFKFVSSKNKNITTFTANKKTTFKSKLKSFLRRILKV